MQTRGPDGRFGWMLAECRRYSRCEDEMIRSCPHGYKVDDESHDTPTMKGVAYKCREPRSADND